MYSGERINSTKNRSVLHVALRAPRDAVIQSDGNNVVPDVWKVLDKIREFSERVRSGSWVGATGKALKDVVAIGIGGSFLGSKQEVESRWQWKWSILKVRHASCIHVAVRGKAITFKTLTELLTMSGV